MKMSKTVDEKEEPGPKQGNKKMLDRREKKGISQRFSSPERSWGIRM